MRLIICVAFTLISLALQAQVHNYNFYNISTENGLPTDDIQFVYQDSYGYLWLASYDGLIRWDGYYFKRYYHRDSDSLSLAHNIVYSIYEDADRKLWIGTIEGLNVYDRL